MVLLQTVLPYNALQDMNVLKNKTKFFLQASVSHGLRDHAVYLNILCPWFFMPLPFNSADIRWHYLYIWWRYTIGFGFSF